MIQYADSLTGIEPRHLAGSFAGWSHPPPPETHPRLLTGIGRVLLAFDPGTEQVVGFVTALTDGVLTWFIPLREVIPAYQGRGIGQALMRQMLARLAHLPNVDLLCDPGLVPFYERFGKMAGTGMAPRRRMG